RSDRIDLGVDDLAVAGIGDRLAELAREGEPAHGFLPGAGEELRARERLVHRGQVEVLELGLVLLAEGLAAASVVERGLGGLQLGVHPRALPFGAREARTLADLPPVEP